MTNVILQVTFVIEISDICFWIVMTFGTYTGVIFFIS